MDAPLMILRSSRALGRAPTRARCLSTVAQMSTPLNRPLARARPATASPISQGSVSTAGCRTFFSLADMAKFIIDAAKPGGGFDGDVQQFHARKILPYTQEQLYSIVADIPSYSSFIPFCTSSQITSSTNPSQTLPSTSSPSSSSSSIPPPSTQATSKPLPFDAQASLSIGFASFAERFTSRVQGVPYEEVKATAVDSPLFKGLKTTWRFAPASPTSPHSTATPTGLPSSTTTPSPSTSPSSSNSSAPTTPLSTVPPASPVSSGPTLLTIDLTFSFVNPLHQITSRAFMPKLEELMIGAFEKRCLEVYGRGRM